MGGEIVLSKPDEPERYWFVASWLHKYVVERILACGGSLPQPLIERMKETLDPLSNHSLDLSELDKNALNRFRDAAEVAYASDLKSNGADWKDPEFWPIYIREFAQLLKLIDQDPRKVGSNL